MSNQLRAELIGSDYCTATGFSATGPTPVLSLCRQLVTSGFDPSRPLEVYRGDTLALRIRSIGAAARLTVKDNRLGRPIFARWQDRAGSDAAAPPITPMMLARAEGAAP